MPLMVRTVRGEAVERALSRGWRRLGRARRAECMPLQPCCSGIAGVLKEREEDITDGCCAIPCFCCMVNQVWRVGSRGHATRCTLGGKNLTVP